MGEKFYLENCFLKVDSKIFEKLQEKNFYIVDSGDTKIIMEHSQYKTLIIFTLTQDDIVTVRFKNSQGEFYLKNAWCLGTKDDLILDDIFSIMSTNYFLLFCQTGIKLEPLHLGKDSKNNIPIFDNDILTDTQKKIQDICSVLSELLVYKNQKYGNSAIEPVNVFYKGNNTNSILIRLDDKLSRIKNSQELRVNDICDTLGYLVLLLIANKVNINDIKNLKD